MDITELTKVYFRLNKEEQEAFKIIIGLKPNTKKPKTRVISSKERMATHIPTVDEFYAMLIKDWSKNWKKRRERAINRNKKNGRFGV